MVDYKCFVCIDCHDSFVMLLIQKFIIMRRKNLKSLALNKNKVSNLTDRVLGGSNTLTSTTFSVTGYPTSTQLTDIACTLNCGGTTGPAPSGTPDCKKK